MMAQLEKNSTLENVVSGSEEMKTLWNTRNWKLQGKWTEALHWLQVRQKIFAETVVQIFMNMDLGIRLL